MNYISCYKQFISLKSMKIFNFFKFNSHSKYYFCKFYYSMDNKPVSTQQQLTKKQKQGPKDEEKSKKKQQFSWPQLNKIKITPPSSPLKQSILVTSALPYVNNIPHLGNIIGSVLSADVFSRFCRLKGLNTLYICGTDEYGTATQIKAFQQGKTPKQICDYYYEIHKKVYEWFDISFDYFGRTSTQWHKIITQNIFQKLKQHQFIKEGKIDQVYCQKCKFFLADRFVFGICPFCKNQDARGDQCNNCQKLLDPIDLIQPKCFLCKNTPTFKQSNHLYVKLSSIQPQLQNFLQKVFKNEKWNDHAISQTKAWIKKGLIDKCITRDLKWGIPVPLEGYQEKVFYVWFDAPIGYISISANFLNNEWQLWWKNNKEVKIYQFMGKDNLPFHAIIFPCCLIGTRDNYNLVDNISTTEYLNYQDGKFSKRNHLGVFGDDAMQSGIPSQIWRYYLLSTRPQKCDSKFTWKQFESKNNNELLANIGNLCHRVFKFVQKNYQRIIPSIDIKNITESQKNLFQKQFFPKFRKFINHLNKVQIKDALSEVMLVSTDANRYLQNEKPWDKQKKQSGRYLFLNRTDIIIVTMLNFIRILSALFEPFVPSLSAKINYLLGLTQRNERDNRMFQYLQKLMNGDQIQKIYELVDQKVKLPQPIPLIRQISQQQTLALKDKFKGI